MVTHDLRVGWVQGPMPAETDPHGNWVRGIADAAAHGAQLVVLPELHGGPYFCVTEELRHFDRAETVPGPTTEVLSAAAKEHGVVIVGSVFERRSTAVFHNTAVVLDRDGSLAGTYRKMHIPDDPGYSEKFYFTPGDAGPEGRAGFEPIDTAVGRLGVLVCWDQWFPEAARLMALAGADVLIYPTAIGWVPEDDEAEKESQRDAWVTMHRAHAIANGLPVVAVNRVGHESDPSGATSGATFWGTSTAVDSFGRVLLQSSATAECTGVVTLSAERAAMDRRVWPFFRDRRIDAYAGLLERWRRR